MKWNHLDNGHPASRLVVLCYGTANFADVEPLLYLAWYDVTADVWVCDATGQRVGEPTWWAQVEPPGRYHVDLKVSPNPAMSYDAPVNIKGYQVVDATSAVEASSIVQKQMADLFEGHDISTTAVQA